jgi:hypothetical protein
MSENTDLGWGASKETFDRQEDGTWKGRTSGEVRSEEEWKRLEGTWCKFTPNEKPHG